MQYRVYNFNCIRNIFLISIWWLFYCSHKNRCYCNHLLYVSHLLFWYFKLSNCHDLYSVMHPLVSFLSKHIKNLSVPHCCQALPARPPAAGLQGGSASCSRTPPEVTRPPSAGPGRSGRWGTTSSPRSLTDRSWWDWGCLCLPACRRAVSGSCRLRAATAHLTYRSRRSAGAGAAEIAAVAPASECPSRKKAWWKKRPDWETLSPAANDAIWSPEAEAKSFVSERRVKEPKSPCVKVERARALLVFHAAGGGLAGVQLWHASPRAQRRVWRVGRGKERSILFGWLNSAIWRKSWLSQHAVLSLSVTSYSGGRDSQSLSFFLGLPVRLEDFSNLWKIIDAIDSSGSR